MSRILAAGVLAVLVARNNAAAAEPPPLPERPVRLTLAVLVGTGYGSASGTGDVNADVRYSGSSAAALGQVVPEVGLLATRVPIFGSGAARYQIIEGTTDAYANGRVYHARRSAIAWLAQVGWLVPSSNHRLQPYLSVVGAYGRIAHLAPLPSLRCGPQNNESCVDTISSAPWFLGLGSGVRVGLTRRLQVVVAVEAVLAVPHRNVFNTDVDLGLAVIF